MIQVLYAAIIGWRTRYGRSGDTGTTSGPRCRERGAGGEPVRSRGRDAGPAGPGSRAGAAMTIAQMGRPTFARAAAWLRAGRSGMFLLALLVGAGAGLGAVAFRYLIYFFTRLATGHSQFGHAGDGGSSHLPWLGLGFFVVIPVIGGLLYGPLIYQWAREARGHGGPEVMVAVADNGGRIRWQVAVVKSLASALCIGSGGSVGREGPIVQIGSALASSAGQWVRLPENRLRIMVACGAAGGISATVNAPFTVMLSAMLADAVAIPFLGDRPFLSGFPSGIALNGLLFKNVVYTMEDLCDRLWKSRPEWARPAVGGAVLGLVLLALPQMYGVGYPVMYKAVGGGFVLWFLLILCAGENGRVQPAPGHRRVGRGVRAVAVHRRHLRHGLRRDRRSRVRPGGRPAGPVRGGGHGRGVHLRRPGPAHLGGQRGRTDRRLHPPPAGHAGSGHRHRHLPRAELRHDLHHQAAAPRAGHRPGRALAAVSGSESRRRDAPLPATARGGGWDGRRRQPGGCQPGLAARAGDLLRRPAGRGPPDRRHPPTGHTCARRRPFPARPGTGPPAAAQPVARLPGSRDPPRRRLAGLRTGARRYNLAARLHPGLRAAQPQTAGPPPRPHPGL